MEDGYMQGNDLDTPTNGPGEIISKRTDISLMTETGRAFCALQSRALTVKSEAEIQDRKVIF